MKYKDCKNLVAQILNLKKPTKRISKKMVSQLEKELKTNKYNDSEKFIIETALLMKDEARFNYYEKNKYEICEEKGLLRKLKQIEKETEDELFTYKEIDEEIYANPS